MAKPEDVFLEAIDKQMDDFVDKVFAKSQQNLIDDGKIDTGELLKSGNINRKFLEKTIIYTAPYADSIEFGRFPGTMPPVEPLIDWVRRKLGVRNLKEARSTAWAVATAIKQRGLQPSPYLQPAITNTNAEFKIKQVRA